MNHPCNNSACPEYNHGQCFGMGCRLNPMPAPREPDNTQTNDTEDKDNG